ncbi:uncharacterized protein B0H18DRAFT_882859, partial [Fomitopsis serialis]|uniref:uncharacterized protein n=1 Tax=Fomitopsis serialis TaxID=139415 RepID=UPI002007FE65
PLPLPSDAPPPGFEHEHIEDYSSVDSNTAAFATNLDRRDVFLGQQACIVCGADIVERCHVIPPSERETWEDLQNRGYVPTTAKSASDELRNAITLCPNHHKRFDSYQAFIRFCPEVRKYVFVNYSETPSETAFHGKAVALESHHDHAPFPAVFLIHECRVRGFWPFRSPTVDILSPVPWQDWLLSREIIDSEENIRHEGRAGPVASTYVHAPGPTMPLPFPAFPACVDPVLLVTGMHTIPPPTTDFVALVLAAAQSMPTWRACQIEGQSWEGAAEENITKYQHAVGSDQVERAQHGGLPFF